jgi:hypothetical protein
MRSRVARAGATSAYTRGYAPAWVGLRFERPRNLTTAGAAA